MEIMGKRIKEQKKTRWRDDFPMLITNEMFGRIP